jgi:hypothetical protein
MLQKQMEDLLKQLQGQGFGGGGIVPIPFPNVPGGNVRIIPGGRAIMAPNLEPRLGIRIEKPAPALSEQLDLPVAQGLVVTESAPGSVGGKAGVKTHDVLLQIGGKNVPNDPTEFQKLMQEFKKDSSVDLVVLRKGRRETVKNVTLPEAKPQAPMPNQPGLVFPGFPGLPGFPPNGLPNFPNPVPIPVPPPGGNVPGLPPVPQQGIQIDRVNDAFSVKIHQNGVHITVTGSREDGKNVVSSISIEENGQTSRYDSLERVPQRHRDTINRALAGIR